MENTAKGILAAVSAFLLSLFGALSPWVWLILIAMIIDYLTGMAAAYINSELDSRKGIKGLIKKVGYVALIATAMIADQVMTEGAGFLGFDLPMKGFFALLVIFWLLINEMISILENLGRVGIERPAFFVKILERLKQIVDQKGDKFNG